MFEIALVGGGIVGNAMARAIRHSEVLSQLQTVHLYPEPAQALTKYASGTTTPFSNRVVSLRPAAVDFLETTGVMAYLHSHHAGRFHFYKSLRIHDMGNLSSAPLVLTNTARGYTGMMIEQNLLTHALACAPLPGTSSGVDDPRDIQTLDRTMLSRVSFPENGPRFMHKAAYLHCTRNQSSPLDLEAKLVIGCDGRPSFIRSGIVLASHNSPEDKDSLLLRHDYAQVGLVATLHMDSCSGYSPAYANQYFGEPDPANPARHGSITAILPLSESRASLVYSVDRAYYNSHIQNLSDQDLISHLNKILVHHSSPNCSLRAPVVTRISPGSRAIFPLSRQLSTHYVSQNAVIIGDAAHGIHPIAGLGVNLGLDDVTKLTSYLEAAVLAGQNIASISTLSGFETQQLQRNTPLILAIDAVKLLYSTSNPVVRLLRGLGGSLIGRSQLLQNALTSFTSE